MTLRARITRLFLSLLAIGSLDVLLLIPGTASQGTCTVGTLGDGLQNHPLSQHIFYLHQPQFEDCFGQISMLRFRVYSQDFIGQAPTTVYVTFWRPKLDTGGVMYTPVGAVRIVHNSTDSSPELCEFDAQAANIMVQPGDRMGIWMEGAALKLNFLTIPTAQTIVEPVRNEVKFAALGTGTGSDSTEVVFQRPPNMGVIAMEVVIIPSLDRLSPMTTTPVTVTTVQNRAVVSTTNQPRQPTLLSTQDPSLPNVKTTTNSVVKNTFLPTRPTSSEQPSHNTTIDRKVGISIGDLSIGGPNFIIIMSVAGGVPVVLLLVVCVVVLCLLVRQWRVGGRPFRKIPTEITDSCSTQIPLASPAIALHISPHPRKLVAESHNYHVVDRNSHYKSSSDIVSVSGRPDSRTTTTVSLATSVATNPLYEVTHCRHSEASSSYSTSGQESNEYYSPPPKSSATAYAYPTAPGDCKQGTHMESVTEESEEGSCEDDPYWTPPTSEVELYAVFQNKKFKMIQRNEVELSETIGLGQFGNVCMGVWTQGDGESVDVAVKTLRKKAILEDRLKFLREAAIMGQFMHPFIVKMHGVVLRDNPVMIVLELLPRGDLKNYLDELGQAWHTLAQETLQRKFLGYAQQISAGMNYLGNKKFVHRDLAARNILMANEDTCKIGDFGMARDLVHENYYVANGGKIPVKWTSLEALQYQKYSKASDVWSFGVVLYEIWGLGAVPYEGMLAMDIIDYLKTGRRLSPPPGCPRVIYELMIRSWHPEASHRPPFSTFLLTLNNLYEDVVGWSTDQTSAQHQVGRSVVLGRSLYPDLQDSYCPK